MTILPFSLSPLPHRPVHAVLAITLASVLLSVLSGCDAVKIRSSSATGPSSEASELRVDADAIEKADLFFRSGTLSKGEALSIELVDDQYESPLTRVTHEGTGEGQNTIRATFDALNPTSVTAECRYQDTVLFERNADLSPEHAEQLSEAEEAAPKQGQLTVSFNPTGASGQEPDSYHYYDNGETVVVGVDYEDDSDSKSSKRGAAIQFNASSKTHQCTHVFFTLEGVSSSFSPDGVVFSGKTDNLHLTEKELR